MTRRAFTLIEVLVALVIILILAGAVYRFMSGIAEDRARIETVANRNIGATRLFTLIETDLLTCVAVADDARPGVQGDSSGLRISRRAVKLSADNVPDFSDATSTRYQFEKSAKAVVASRDDRPAEELLAQVSLVRFRYFHEGQWVRAFDSSTVGTVPAAVEVSVWFSLNIESQNDVEDEDLRLPPPDRIRVIGVHDAVAFGGGAP